jgi:hypothetical protein
MEATNLKKAVLWEPQEDKKVRCNLCNWRCLIDVGKLGRCCVRQNMDGVLYALTYDKVCSANPDPIEKKPLFHFQPGTRSFSIATMGCNFQCEFCQNWQISQAALERGRINGEPITPEQIVEGAVRNRLLVPGENDSDDELKQLADFIVTKAGADVPWHISRFHPQYKYLDSVPTPIGSLERAHDIGIAAGLHYVYLGNVPGSKSESTFCYNCGRMLIERIGYRIAANHIANSCCPDCGTKIAGFEL